ncbi:Hypothetical predicted protein [Olea europaea subsp. europaea]|uniref:Leucine-rich repeat-containing N-terminal plant-type domain-containing protein n=1 Tax=Olea europaea subsp. europaea TaxID=158383 RepID=A0A8S0UFD0_OLEEU|nr:Hypothetical predicted protein [Olea europaea subsp. europaea]
MGIKLWVTLVMPVLSLLNGWYCLGCWEEERTALLHLKANINFPDGRSLTSWVVNEIGTDCCQWQGVECSNTTKQVIHLNLDFAMDQKLGDWYFNASLFLPFQELRNLSLSGNQLVGWIENEGNGRLFGLTKLEVLHIWGTDWFGDNDILSMLNLKDFTNLKELDLSQNKARSLGTIFGVSSHFVLHHYSF